MSRRRPAQARVNLPALRRARMLPLLNFRAAACAASTTDRACVLAKSVNPRRVAQNAAHRRTRAPIDIDRHVAGARKHLVPRRRSNNLDDRGSLAGARRTVNDRYVTSIEPGRWPLLGLIETGVERRQGDGRQTGGLRAARQLDNRSRAAVPCRASSAGERLVSSFESRTDKRHPRRQAARRRHCRVVARRKSTPCA